MSRYATHKARRRFERRPCEGRRRSAARPWTSPSPHFPCSIIFFVSLSLCSSFVWTLKRTRQRRNGWPHGKPNGEAEIEFKQKKRRRKSASNASIWTKKNWRWNDFRQPTAAKLCRKDSVKDGSLFIVLIYFLAPNCWRFFFASEWFTGFFIGSDWIFFSSRAWIELSFFPQLRGEILGKPSKTR